MAYLFGVEAPIIEILVILSLLLIISLIFEIYTTFRMRTINRKLSKLVVEEKILKEELDLTKLEEDKQLVLMQELVGQLSNFMVTKGKKSEALISTKNMLKQFKGKMKPGQRGKFMSRFVDQVNKLEDLSQAENKQLTFIKKILHKFKK